jgi:putative membrane protein
MRATEETRSPGGVVLNARSVLPMLPRTLARGLLCLQSGDCLYPPSDFLLRELNCLRTQRDGAGCYSARGAGTGATAACLSRHKMKTFSSLPLTGRSLLLAAAAGLLAPELAASASSNSGLIRQAAVRSMMRGYVAEPLAADAARPAERSFLQKAIETSRLQLRLAELGASQATASEVRSHAEQLKSDNRQLVDAIDSVMQKRGVGTLEPTGRPTEDAYVKLANRTSGEFDREFVRLMAEVHENTINMFEQAASEAKDADVRDLAAAQLPMLRAHRNRITELKRMFD